MAAGENKRGRIGQDFKLRAAAGRSWRLKPEEPLPQRSEKEYIFQGIYGLSVLFWAARAPHERMSPHEKVERCPRAS